MTELGRVDTARVMDDTGKYSIIVINAMRGGREVRMQAIRLIESDIAQAQEAIDTAKRAKAYITEAIKHSNTVTQLRRDIQS